MHESKFTGFIRQLAELNRISTVHELLQTVPRHWITVPAMLLYIGGLLSGAHRYVTRFRSLSLFDKGLFLIAASYFISSIFSNSMFYTTPYFYMVLGFTYARLHHSDDIVDEATSIK